MTKRLASTIALILLLAPAGASAQIRQVGSASSDHRNTVNFTVGYFALKGLESRVADDAITGDLINEHPLSFQVKDLNPAMLTGEYLFAVSRNVEFGVGLGFAQRTAASVYVDRTHSNGDEIFQDIKLRQVPVAFTGRVLLMPIGSAVEPYVGAGVVAIRYQYSETGEFIDNDVIFPAIYKVKGTTSGPMVLAGLRAPVGNLTAGGEVRWQTAEAKGLAAEGFLGDKLDLGGWHANFTFGVRF